MAHHGVLLALFLAAGVGDTHADSRSGDVAVQEVRLLQVTKAPPRTLQLGVRCHRASLALSCGCPVHSSLFRSYWHSPCRAALHLCLSPFTKQSGASLQSQAPALTTTLGLSLCDCYVSHTSQTRCVTCAGPPSTGPL